MVTVRDVYDFMDSIAPFSTQLDFDNSGLLVGDPDRPVQKIAVSLDITPDTVREASESGADLLVSHHPVIFRPRKRLLEGDPVYRLVCGGMSAICCHTPLDIAAGGVNDVLAARFRLSKVEAVSTETIPVPMVRVGFLREPMRAIELAATAAENLSAKVRWCDGGKTIETLAVCGGAGGDLVADIAALGVDALVTGDADYHDFLDAEQLGVTLIAAGHFETEYPVIPVLAERLRSRFSSVEVAVLQQNRSIKHI
ncbi:MAG: Nif3-like dinuclear metal center hexameric protein [Clostridia bacterium]|nr:Nif3-like dinuclear metal center hexameric protein [Clostridia bacterium]